MEVHAILETVNWVCVKPRHMKRLLLITILLVSTKCFSQQSSIDTGYNILYSFGVGEEGFNVVSKYDTTILNNGKEKCSHSFAKKYAKQGAFSGVYISCLVNHGIAGCPDTWEHYKAICRHCLRHIEVKETKLAFKKVDEYDALLEKLNKK